MQNFVSTPARFVQTALRHADQPAYFVRGAEGWKATTWNDYGDQVDAAARALLALNVNPGDVVCVLGFNRPEWAIMDMAAMMIGAVPAGIYWTSPPNEIEYVLKHSRSPVLLVDSDERHQQVAALRAQLPHLRQVILMKGATALGGALSWVDFVALGEVRLQTLVERRLHELQPSDPGTHIYTSGTTGPPKAVVLSHANLAWSATALGQALAATAQERVISYLPLAHVAEQMVSIHTPALVGFPIYFARSLDELGEHLREVRPTIFFGVPRVWEKMHAGIQAKLAAATGVKKHLAAWALRVGQQWHGAILDGRQPGAWLSWQKQWAGKLIHQKVKAAIGLDQAHMLSSGAAPIAAEKLKFMTGLDLVIREVYGQSETCGATSLSTDGATRIGSVGRPLTGVDMRIAADGEIMVRGPHIFQGYAGSPQATAAAMDGDWLFSGDLGHIDADGYLYITGRKKDLLITSGGKNISPANIESDLMTVPLVEHAVVCGDGRHYLSALLTVNQDALAALAAASLISGPELHRHPLVLEALQRGIDEVNARQARVAHIRKFSVLPRALSIEGGDLTPTLKVKRKAVIDRYQHLVDEMYEDQPAMRA
ncbi:long-chain fatty acid--CoA ligase [Aquabacterium sp.]|uniref:AMP-dependent synthetase/ligase n=1 Tax=Aquabacterium sp. TaxID=1872578 RepID=UPI0019B38E9C|nr:long-chain fatty acid--CoA ligase [Aquabacterium sp.]MBC7698833.1 long-chain fatty acid--CoA ligase [Aquabacterium sp.]